MLHIYIYDISRLRVNHIKCVHKPDRRIILKFYKVTDSYIRAKFVIQSLVGILENSELKKIFVLKRIVEK